MEAIDPALDLAVDRILALFLIGHQADGANGAAQVPPLHGRGADAHVLGGDGINDDLARGGFPSLRCRGTGTGFYRGEIHAADGAQAGRIPDNEGMHAAGVLHLRLRRRFADRGNIPGRAGMAAADKIAEAQGGGHGNNNQ